MSRATNTTLAQPLVQPAVQQSPTFGERASAYASQAEQAAKSNLLEGEMGNPLYLIGINLIATLLFAAIVFYLEYVYFNVSGLIQTAGVSGLFVSAHGLFFYFCGLLMIMGGACAFALSYIKNETALLYSIILSAMFTLLFWLGLKNLTDQASSGSFWTWVVIGILAPLVAGFYGWWSISGVAKAKAAILAKTKEATPDDADAIAAAEKVSKAYGTRSMYALILFVVDVLGCAGVAAGFYILSPALTA